MERMQNNLSSYLALLQ